LPKCFGFWRVTGSVGPTFQSLYLTCLSSVALQPNSGRQTPMLAFIDFIIKPKQH